MLFSLYCAGYIYRETTVQKKTGKKREDFGRKCVVVTGAPLSLRQCPRTRDDWLSQRKWPWRKQWHVMASCMRSIHVTWTCAILLYNSQLALQCADAHISTVPAVQQSCYLDPAYIYLESNDSVNMDDARWDRYSSFKAIDQKYGLPICVYTKWTDFIRAFVWNRECRCPTNKYSCLRKPAKRTDLESCSDGSARPQLFLKRTILQYSARTNVLMFARTLTLLAIAIFWKKSIIFRVI